MRLVLAVLVNSVLIVNAATPLLAKANTVKITIKGSNFKTPIEISDPKILANFQVWTGPGTSSNEKQGFIIDWSQGPVVRRGHGVMYQGYQVSFHTGPNDQIAYVVLYGFSPGEEQGYVYLPGESDPWYGLNVRTVFRGVEGKLFRAWDVWERVARPLIEKAEHLEADPLTRERIVARIAFIETGNQTSPGETVARSDRLIWDAIRFPLPASVLTDNKALGPPQLLPILNSL